MRKGETRAALLAAGRMAERTDILAFIGRKGGAASRMGERGDDSASLTAHRLAALAGEIGAGLHVGEGGKP